MYVEANGTLFDLGYIINAMGSFNRYTKDGYDGYQFRHAYFYSGYCAVWYVTNYKNPN